MNPPTRQPGEQVLILAPQAGGVVACHVEDEVGMHACCRLEERLTLHPRSHRR